jgi:hypothetical protein
MFVCLNDFCKILFINNKTSHYGNLGMDIFMPPIIKCLGHYVMAYASVSVSIWFPSIIGQTQLGRLIRFFSGGG